MELDDSILDQEELAVPAEEEPNLFGWGPNNIFEQDVSATSPQPSVYGMSQLLTDVNTPTPKDHSGEYPLCSLTTETALQPCDLDWNNDVEQEAPSYPVLKEENVEAGCYQDLCLPSLPSELIPQDLGCSRQRFEQEFNQYSPVPWMR